MTGIIHDEVTTVFHVLPEVDHIRPDHDSIFRRGLEAAEMEWLRAKARGMVDPVIELSDQPVSVLAGGPSGDPIPVDVELRVLERDELVGLLMPLAREVAEELAAVPPPETPMTIVVATIGVFTIIQRPAP